eukprot:CAMPEP_0206456726 /NCGR_PEP_ID=MMETSP0324_2-20121206/22541_1 /ASSEMBLY_ACC=CAM_ASM_000836 /TAXON_ID=2866 /ORGANISM="Crypthecodinium cohnii, Strain Seligo" /LENGTH=454 /DNA_ID=CAMNT_0053927719 /DNA_START=25 /DNA_END=1386 /DNA_ORIENTATION=+
MAAKYSKDDIREWLHKNQDNVRKAGNIISSRLLDKKKQWQEMPAGKGSAISDELFHTIMKSFNDGDRKSESSSVLLYGEPGSGKTHIVEWCIQQLQDSTPDVLVLRAMGGFYASDVECVRHLVSQAAGQAAFASMAAPKGNASFETGMEWVRQVLADSFKKAKVAIVVLDGFEYFCSKSRQTLLYNLFDIAQTANIGLSIIAVAESINVLSMLEKRIRSRFSMLQLQSHLPDAIPELLTILKAKVRLPSTTDLKASFVKEFTDIVDMALTDKIMAQSELALQIRTPMWFLRDLLPIYKLIYDYSFDKDTVPKPLQKKMRIATAQSSRALESESLQMLYRGLSESEMIVCLAIFRLKDRTIVPNLHRILNEIQMLHDQNKTFVTPFFQDSYYKTFNNLVDRQIIQVVCGSGPHNNFTPCLLTSSLLDDLVQDLECSKPTIPWNPLLSLPVAVQHW